MATPSGKMRSSGEESSRSVPCRFARSITCFARLYPCVRAASKLLAVGKVIIFHPWDGSLHIVLPPDLAMEAITAGWAGVHPVARAGMAPLNRVMLYGPVMRGRWRSSSA